jgi:hypothetical protein
LDRKDTTIAKSKTRIAMTKVFGLDQILSLTSPSKQNGRLNDWETAVAVHYPELYGLTPQDITRAITRADSEELSLTLKERVLTTFARTNSEEKAMNYLSLRMDKRTSEMTPERRREAERKQIALINARKQAGKGLAGNGVVSKSLGHILNKFAVPGETQSTSRSLGRLMWKARQSPSLIQSLAKKPKL